MAYRGRKTHKKSSRRIERQTKPAAAAVCNFLRAFLDYGICLYFILILAVMPFYFREGYSHIGTDKAVFFCEISVRFWRILLPCALIYSVIQTACSGEKCRIRKLTGTGWTRTDFFVVFYGIAVLLSYLCSRHKETALWGTERWYMGFWPQIFLILVYFLASRFWRPRKWMLCLMMAASALVFALGCLNRFSIYPIQMKQQNPQFISTIGNINWYCGYMVPVLFVGVGLWWLKADWSGREKTAFRKLPVTACAVYMAIGFGTLVTQGSDSGIAALAVVLLVMFCLSAAESSRMLSFFQVMLLLCGACVITGGIWRAVPDRMNYESGGMNLLLDIRILILMTCVSVFGFLWVDKKRKMGTYCGKRMGYVSLGVAAAAAAAVALVLIMMVVNTIRPGSLGTLSSHPLFNFSEDWGSNRGATWKAGWMCFSEQDVLHKFTGVGPDAMWKTIQTQGSEELRGMINRKFGGLNLVNAHNEWLTVLVNTGVLGLTGFAGMILTGITGFLREGKRNPIVCACGLGLLGYTVNNIFSFQQAMGAATIFAIFGMGRAFQRQNMENLS